jgi:hypothetical protein
MRKVMSKEELEKKDKRNKTIIGIIIIGLMVLSTAGYAFFSGDTSSSSQKVKYNNIDFLLNEDQRWHFTISNQEFATSFNPTEVKNITIQGDYSLADYSNKPLYLHFENNNEVQQEILYNLNGVYTRANPFCFSNENCSWVEKNCDDDNLIIIKEARNSLIKQNNKCVYIDYNETEGLKVADAFIFKLLKIT